MAGELRAQPGSSNALYSVCPEHRVEGQAGSGGLGEGSASGIHGEGAVRTKWHEVGE